MEITIDEKRMLIYSKNGALQRPKTGGRGWKLSKALECFRTCEIRDEMGGMEFVSSSRQPSYPPQCWVTSSYPLPMLGGTCSRKMILPCFYFCSFVGRMKMAGIYLSMLKELQGVYIECMLQRYICTFVEEKLKKRIQWYVHLTKYLMTCSVYFQSSVRRSHQI